MLKSSKIKNSHRKILNFKNKLIIWHLCAETPCPGTTVVSLVLVLGTCKIFIPVWYLPHVPTRLILQGPVYIPGQHWLILDS